jgi:thioredoxin 1
MATVELTTANFDEVTEQPGIVLVDFWADWCGPCKRFAPVYERSSEKHEEIVFGKVDTEAQQEVAAKFDIRSIPTIMAVRDGVIVFAQPGALPGPGGDPGTQVATGNRCGQWVFGSRCGDPEGGRPSNRPPVQQGRAARRAAGQPTEIGRGTVFRSASAEQSAGKRTGHVPRSAPVEQSTGQADGARGARRTVGAIRWRANAPHALRSAPAE